MRDIDTIEAELTEAILDQIGAGASNKAACRVLDLIEERDAAEARLPHFDDCLYCASGEAMIHNYEPA